MKDFFFAGGPLGMTTILVLAIVVFIATIAEVYRRSSKVPFSVTDRRLLLTISSLGGLAILFGIFYQVLGLYQAYQAIRMAGDVSPSLVMGGVFISFYAPLFGLGVGLISFIFWYAIKMIWPAGE